MTASHTEGLSPPTARAPAGQPARLWYPVLLVALFWAATWLLDEPELRILTRFILWAALPVLLTVLFLVWWLRRSTVSRADRWRTLLVFLLGGVAAALLAHRSLGPVIVMRGLPLALTAWTAALLLARRASLPAWRWTVAAAVLLAWGSLTLVRMDGMAGDMAASFHPRWSPTAEQILLAEGTALPADRPGAAVTLLPGDWPGFRGPARDSSARAALPAARALALPPRRVWQRRVGPGWSSVAVVGGRLYTQEQRGDKETVTCYDAATGEPVWAHEDEARFWEVVSGAGPRATPTFADGRVYALGGAGRLNCLDAATGALVWTRNLAADTSAPLPMWGFASSPLVTDGLVISFIGGDPEGSLVACRADTGETAWRAPAGHSGYGSPQPATLAGRPQILFLGDTAVTAHDPATGRVLWRHEVGHHDGGRSLQPLPVGDNQVLFGSANDVGLVLLDVAPAGDGWTVAPRWTARTVKPSFNDVVVHQGHAYLFNGRVFSCIDLATGRRAWAGDRYGYGQVLLLADVSLLVVVSDTGEIIVLDADPADATVRGRFQAVTGKTWNHPVAAHGYLYVRNAEEMACYDLAGRGSPLAARTPEAP